MRTSAGCYARPVCPRGEREDVVPRGAESRVAVSGPSSPSTPQPSVHVEGQLVPKGNIPEINFYFTFIGKFRKGPYGDSVICLLSIRTGDRLLVLFSGFFFFLFYYLRANCNFITKYKRRTQ